MNFFLEHFLASDVFFLPPTWRNYHYSLLFHPVSTTFPYLGKISSGGIFFRYFIYLPHDYNNFKKMPKKIVGRDGEEA